ncbi:YbjN domain-containing protein [Xylanimonas sp. McL0601]|uniref:YbjN domain-containing protein n=1 Tax=Xylanimonas sp. McL0601 TaxID=3414739 RepID=UPI003CEA0B9B
MPDGGASTRDDDEDERDLDEDELRDRIEGVLLRVAGGARTPGQAPLDATLVPTPLSRDRITAWLGRSGFAYFTDSDGDLGGLWHGRLFYFLVLGDQDEVLQVRGQWNRDATIERLEELLEACNAWNADHIWPKAYARVRDDGSVVVCADTTVDVEHGVTDDQLDQLLQCGLTTGSMFFDSLDAEYPDPLRSAP